MYHEFSLFDMLRCPASQEKLEKLEPWLYSCSHDDLLLPVFCDTPILHPNIDMYIQQYGTAILKAFALFGVDSDSRDWFLKRYGPLSFQEMPMIDALIEGEGFPDFLDKIDLPDFLEPFKMDSSDDLIYDLVGKHHPDLALDLGCGQGGMAYRMSKICTHVIGVESHFFLAALAMKHMKSDHITIHSFDPVKGRRTSELYKKPTPNVNIICADARYLPFTEPLFDWVHMGHFIDLISEPETVLNQVMKILKPGGTLSISTPMDFEDHAHLDEFVSILNEDFTCTYNEESMPWLRYNHKRRWVIHEDWVWIGKLRK